jgi:acyl phosphate:glycerol-3-phosphate acyltransferase
VTGSGAIVGALVLGYLLGAIPFGLILARLAGHGDIRRIGSGNIGATNVLRTGDKRLAALTLALDMAKGAVAVLIAREFGPMPAIAAASGAVLGHLFPAWLGFKGGKGVATALGVLLALDWQVGAAACATWLAVAAALRYSSLASLIALAAAPAYAWIISGSRTLAGFALALAALLWLRHRANIARLVAGTEPRIF